MTGRIVAVSGPLAGQIFQLRDSPVTFGRSPNNTIVLVSQHASRRHAEIRREGGVYILCDLGSANGTLLNGRPIQRQLLRTGDTFAIGDEIFRFEEAVLEPTQPVANPPVAPPPIAHPPSLATPPAAHTPFALPPTPAALPRRRFPLCLIGSLLFIGIVMAAAAAGGVFLWSRSGGNQPPSPTIIADSGETSTGNNGTTSSTTAPQLPTREPPPNAATWTIMVYLDGDNNLEADGINDFLEMSQVGSTDQVHILVELDRIRSVEVWDDRRFGDWDGTLRFRVEAGMEPTRENALADLGERNMGDSATLIDFLVWGIENYPAQRYAIILWDHGASWLGIASDDTDSDVLNLPEISAAFETALRRTRIGGFELIGFDACLMAQIDVLQTVAPHGRVAVASAELEPNSGWAWDAWLAKLVAAPDQDGYAIAPVIVQTYMDSFAGQQAEEVTLSAFDLTRIDSMVRELDALAQELQQSVQQSYTAIGQARSFANVYAPSYSEEFNAIDLPHFLQLLSQQGAAEPVQASAGQLLRTIESARLANGVGSYHRLSGGLSIYFPQLADLYVEAYEQASPIPRVTAWNDFLATYYQAGAAAVQRPTIRDLQVNRTVASIDDPVNLTGTVAGSDIAYVFQFIGIPNERRDTVDLLLVDFIYPPGAAPGSQIPNWEAGEYSLRLNWDASNWYLSNGRDTIEVLLGPIKYGVEFYGVEGIYTSTATGEQINAGLIFSLQGNNAQLIRIWGFPRITGKQDPQPFELTPRAGDTFTAYYRSYTDTGSALEASRFEGQTITFTDVPLSAIRGPIANGDYVMGFLVRDLAGNYHYDYVDITVDNSNLAAPTAPPVAPPGPGSAPADFQLYQSDLGFTLAYPQNWDAFDTGNDRIIFSNRDANDGVYVVVDVYKNVDNDPATANRILMDELQRVIAQTGEIRSAVTDFRLAGLDGLKVEYAYPPSEGETSYVTAIVVTSPNTQWTYLVIVEAPETDFNAYLDLFNTILNSLVIG